MEKNYRVIKEWLNRPRKIWSDIVVLRRQIENLRLTMAHPKAVSYDNVKVQTSPQDPMATFAAKSDELQGELNQKLKDYEQAFDEINAVIKNVENNDARVILTMRYIGWEEWGDIEKEVPFCLRVIYRKHNIGLRAIEKILDVEKVI